ncbi:MAG: metallophosphoesterase [Bauldia sp.]|nr:metallophosphoesterase [Bauldia sp.]
MVVLAHISDIHLGPLPPVRLRELASKRAFGYFNWHRNRSRIYDQRVLSAITADIHANKPDHIAVTGDLVNIGLEAEYHAALDWLKTLGSPQDVTVVPGNHDAYVRRSIASYSAAWRPYLSGDRTDPSRPFPFIRRRGPLALIGVSTAVATAPLMATGRIDEDQAHELGRLLAAAGREGLCRVILIHHPPVKGSTRWFRRLIGADLVRHAVRRFGAELVLHGHNHFTSIAYLHGPEERAVPVVGAATPSILPHGRHPGGAYNLLQIEGKHGDYAIGMVERGFRDGGIATVASHRLDK